MAIISTKKCPLCNRLGRVISSNNPVSPGICVDCLERLVPYTDLNAVDHFCRTYDIPFLPDKWIRIAEEMKENTYEHYVSVVIDEYQNDLNYKEKNDNSSLWSTVNQQWNRNMDFKQILLDMESIKDGWLKIVRSKWGTQYEFSEYLRLEEIYNNTVSSVGTTSPLVLDTIRKLAVTSIKIDKALEEGEVKAAAEYSKMYQTFIKSGGFEEMVDISSDSNVIANVADLCNYLEENNFEFEFYDKVPRDVVDKTILDYQNWMRKFVLDSAGIIQQEYEIISDSWKTKIESDKHNEETKKLTLEEIIEQRKKGINEELDESLENEDFDFEEDDIDDEFKY